MTLKPYLLLALCFSLCGAWTSLFWGGYDTAVERTNTRVVSKKAELTGEEKDCAEKVYESLETSCKDLDFARKVRFASLLTTCYLRGVRPSGPSYELCTDDMTETECSEQFKEFDSSTFDINFRHVEDICAVGEQRVLKSKLSELATDIVTHASGAKEEFISLGNDIRLSRKDIQQVKEDVSKDLQEVKEGVSEHLRLLGTDMNTLLLDIKTQQTETTSATEKLGGSLAEMLGTLIAFRDNSLSQLKNVLGGMSTLENSQQQLNKGVTNLEKGQKDLKMGQDELRQMGQDNIKIQKHLEEKLRETMNLTQDIDRVTRESLELLGELLRWSKIIHSLLKQDGDDYEKYKGIAFCLVCGFVILFFTSTARLYPARLPLLFLTTCTAFMYKWDYFHGIEYYVNILYMVICLTITVSVFTLVPTENDMLLKDVKEIRRSLGLPNN